MDTFINFMQSHISYGMLLFSLCGTVLLFIFMCTGLCLITKAEKPSLRGYGIRSRDVFQKRFKEFVSQSMTIILARFEADRGDKKNVGQIIERWSVVVKDMNSLDDGYRITDFLFGFAEILNNNPPALREDIERLSGIVSKTLPAINYVPEEINDLLLYWDAASLAMIKWKEFEILLLTRSDASYKAKEE